jgi:hypothetical protein
MRRAKKMRPDNSSDTETLSFLDSSLTSIHVARLIRERSPKVQLSEAVSTESNGLKVHWRSPLVEQNLSVPHQYLSFHRTEPTAEDASANPDFQLVGPGEDAAILDWVKPIRNRWNRILQFLGRALKKVAWQETTMGVLLKT